MERPYQDDPLAGDWRAARLPRGASLPLEAARGVVVEDVETGWCGAVVRVETAGGMVVVHLEDRRGRVRGFPLGPGFLQDGRPVTLTAPVDPGRAASAKAARAASARTASGSRAVAARPARVAVGSRLFVEGRHDAELVERVWGDDLRVEGVVVELLEGADHLAEEVRDFNPGPGRRMGVLLDHLVAGSKEARLAAAPGADPRWRDHLLIVGHPFVDVWESIRPERVGLARWPAIPTGQSWKHGVLAHLGWPHETQADVAAGWRRMLGQVRGYADLRPELLGRVEELIDFVTAPTGPR